MSKETKILQSSVNVMGGTNALDIAVVNRSPGNSNLIVKLDDHVVCDVPLDNLIKAATRIDPEHASFAERQIAKLRADFGAESAAKFDLMARVAQLEERIRELTTK